MIGALVAVMAAGLPALPALAEVHEVQQVDLVFIPADITVAPGDTVRWIWNDGFHTVTSGTDCVFDGLYFNELLSSGNPIVEWEVPDDLTGLVPYLCLPHCGLDMLGTIDVEVASNCPGDIDDSGAVDFDDLLAVLSTWGPCSECPADLDRNGHVDFDDLLIVLSNFGPCE